jgi:Ca2+-binding RTX toxin-like protein
MVATTLKRGQLAIIHFNMEDSDDPSTPAVDTMNRDSISFVLLAPIGSGTQIFFTDRSWNGTVFSASGTDGTYTFTAGADMAAGTVITISTAELNAAGINLLDTGEAIYAYQGAINTPTGFLFAIEGGDGNNTFNATLTNTGLVAGVDAIGIGADNASFAGRTWNIQTPTLYTNIGTATNWVTNDNSPQYPDEEGTNLFTAPDRQIWVAGSGGGNAIQVVNTDGTHSSNLLGYAISHLYQNTSVDGNPTTQRFWHPTDVVLDTVNDKFFIVDSDGTVDRILQGSISQALSNPGVAPTMTVLYRELPAVSDGSGITGIAIDTANQDIYFTRNQFLMRVDYNTANQTPITLADLGTDPDTANPTYANEIGLNLGTGQVFIVSTESFTDFLPPPAPNGTTGTVMYRNAIIRVSNVAPSDTNATGNTVDRITWTGVYDETNSAATGTPQITEFEDSFGKIISVDVNTLNGDIWFTTVQLNNGANGELGGIYRASISGTVATVTLVYQETNATNFNFQYIDVDEETGRYYVTSLEPNEANDHSLFSGLLTDAGVAPTFVAHLGNINALGPLGLTVQSAPTLSGTGLTPSVTEASSAPSSGETTQVALYSGLTAADIDPPTGDELSGAQVRISVNFQSGATHQDFLRISGNLSGTIAGSGITYNYNSADGVMTLSGAATVAEYAAALQLVTFSTSGDNVTNYGTAGSRTTAASVFDGLLYSDEVTATITVTGINDAPVNTIQGAALAISEDAVNVVLSTTGNAISVFDVDADPATHNIVVTLSVTQGTLTILTNVVGGIVAGDITGGANGTNTITITATQNEINATLAASNGLLYNPIADYNGSDTLTIVTNDQGASGNDPGLTGTGTSEQDSDTRTINIAAVVDIANDTVNIAEDAGAQNLTLLANDSFENAGRAITAVGTASHGTVTINNNGTAGNLTDDFVVYTATADYNGTDSFTYTVTSGGVTEQATVTVNISAVADIVADTIPLNEDAGPSQLNLLANDTFENSGRAITAVGTASHGTVTINNNGTAGDATDDYVVYTAVADYNGSDSFTYTVTSGGVTEQATATINIAAVADIADDSITVAEDSGTNSLNGIGNISLLANDSFENAGRAITAVGAALHGTTAINNNGTAGDATDDYVTYTPTGNYAGPDSFTYTVTSGGVTETATVNVTVTAVNDGPINAKPGTQTINEDATLTFSAVGGNVISISDIDAAPGMLTVTLAVVNGQLTLSGTAGLSFSGGSDGTDDTSMTFTGTAADINAALNGLLYETTLDYNGSDTLTITTNDNGNTGTPGALQDIDTVTINITAVADIANDTIPLAEDAGASNLNLLGNDSFENPGRSITSVTQGLHGFVSINDNNTVGTTDDFVVYTAAADYNGTDSFTYTVTSGGVTETATANVNISAVVDIANDAPTVGEDSGTTTIDVIANDSFENGGFSITSVTQGLHGTVTIIDGPDADLNPDYVTYTPTADYYGADSFTYTVTSGGVTETATVNVTVSAVADIADDSVGVIQDSGVNALNLLANDTFENAGRGITAVGAALHGTVAINNNGTPGNVTDDFVTYTPTGGYIGPDTFTYTVTSGGVTETATVSVNVAPANLAPVVDLNGTDPGINFASAYTEDGTAAVIADTDVAITDPDVGDDIASATITITDAIAGDQLTVLGALPGSIVATGGGTASITLSGTGTQAEYQQALTQIRYSSTSNDPTVGGTDLTRSVSVTVNDGQTSSTPAAITTVTVTGSNDPPAGTDATITAIEDTPRLLAQADFGFTDPDSANALSAVTITGVTGGTLYYDADGTGGAGLPVAVGSFPQTYTAAELAAGNVSYQANSNLNGNGVGTISFQVIDNSGAPNNTDLSANTLTVNVTPINDQPNIPNSPTVTTDEQVAVTLNAAIAVSDVDLDARNGGNGDYSGAAFAINRSVSNAEDVFSFNVAGAQFTVNGSNLESGGNVIATLAQSGGILNINFVNNGTVPTTALVNDVLQHLQYTNTSNEPPASVTLIYIIDDGAPGSGQGALGAPFNNIDGGQVIVNINSINDAPSGADKLITIDEDVGQVLTTADFGFSDTDNDAFDSAVVVTVTGGTILVDDGNIVTPPVSLTSGTISAADIAAGYVSFQPTANLNGSGAGTISFQVVDNGGTANGGQNTDQSANTITFDIDSVNDAPAGADKTVTGSEDDPLVFTAADFGYADPADSNSLLAVRIMTFPANGTLYLDSDGPGGSAPVDLSTVGAGVYVTNTDIGAGHLYFQPDPDEFGNGYATFTFAVQDDGGITNGGQDTDQTPNTMTINVAPDNLPPAVDLDVGTGGVNYTASYTEDAPGVAIGSGVTVTDPNSGTGDMIESATITLTDRVAGDSLTLTGALPGGITAVTTPSVGAITIQITGTGTGAQYQALIQSILYATTNQDPTVGGTDPARTITVTVNDGLVDSAVATTTVNITALDDAAVAQPDAYTITEQGAIVAGNLFANNGSGADSDPDGPPLAVSAVNGSSGNVGSQITLPSGALLTLTANGMFDYDPNGAFDVTPVPGTGASNTPDSDSFTYTLAGGNTVTVTITITGIDTDDDIIGTAGADTLIADGGTDRLIGLAGDDTYHVNSAGDLVVEAAGEGNDLVYTNTSYALAAGSSVETLSTDALGATDPINLTGNELGNTLFGNAGANRLIGGGGADYMVGFGGDDDYYVDMLSDVVVEAAGQGRDVVYASASYALAAGSSVEVLSTAALGDTTAINLTGNELVNVLYGNAGANRLIGGGGADYMVGFGGDDDYYVDAAGDAVIEAAGQGRDVVYASVSYVLAAGTSIEVLSTIGLAETTAINLTGNELSNTITGNAGANVLNGGGGVDYMAGLGGDDDYYVDNASDVVAENAGGGRDVVYTSTSYTLAAGSSVEILSTIGLLATTPINLTGNELGNGLFGNAGANVLNGGGGADYLVGFGGADSYAFTTALGGGNVDVIIDYSGVGTDGDDRILLDDAVFTGMALGALDPNAFVAGSAALDADDRIIYDASTGALYFDADGSGAGAKVQFATLDGSPALTAGDFFVI